MTIQFRPLSGVASYGSTGAARPGEPLAFSIMLDNTGFRPAQVHLRVAFTPRRRARFITVAWLASENGETARRLGRAIVNAEGKPISLSVRHGTTRLYGAHSACSRQRLIRRLPDGISEGGLDVGSIGGFRRRDLCNGTEFVRFVNFVVDVR